MTDEQIALARRAVACKGWRWIAGMKAIRHEEHCTSWFRIEETLRRLTGDWASALPDLTDPATLGCLLALVREAWGAPRALVRLSANGKSFHVFDVDRVTMGGNWAAFLCGDLILQTEAEALVAALEAADRTRQSGG